MIFQGGFFLMTFQGGSRLLCLHRISHLQHLGAVEGGAGLMITTACYMIIWLTELSFFGGLVGGPDKDFDFMVKMLTLFSLHVVIILVSSGVLSPCHLR